MFNVNNGGHLINTCIFRLELIPKNILKNYSDKLANHTLYGRKNIFLLLIHEL